MKKENTSESESYKKINLETYYRKGSFTNFSEGPKCSLSVTSKIDVTDLYNWSKKYGTKFYINFLYVLSKVLNSRDDYKMEYRWKTKELVCWEKVNPCHYIFFEEKEICTPVYSEYFSDYKKFYDKRYSGSKRKAHLQIGKRNTSKLVRCILHQLGKLRQPEY